jgi:hypothetical protein
MILEALAAIQSGATAVVKVGQLASLTKIAGTAVLGRAYASHAEDARLSGVAARLHAVAKIIIDAVAFKFILRAA